MESTQAILHKVHHDRVRDMTADNINRKIDLKTVRSVRAVLHEGPKAIHKRLDKLDREWDVDRTLMLIFSVLVFGQLVAAKKNRKWLFGPLLQTPFLFLHSAIGWSPPMLVLRPLGFRTRKEIETEREALLNSLNNRQLH